MSFLRASEVLPPLLNIINIVNNPEEINGVIEIKLKELEKKYNSRKYRKKLFTNRIFWCIYSQVYCMSYLLLRTQVRCTLFYKNDTNLFLIILQGWGFRDQNKDFDAFLASYYIGRGGGGAALLGRSAHSKLLSLHLLNLH